jgi:hypothetical protein
VTKLRTLLQAVHEPFWIYRPAQDFALESMLDRDFSAILLSQQGSDYRSSLVAKSVPGNIIGDRQEDQRVEGNLETRI